MQLRRIRRCDGEPRRRSCFTVYRATRTGPARDEVVEILRAIQELSLELRSAPLDDRERGDKERALGQLRWRLAALARRRATDDFGTAA